MSDARFASATGTRLSRIAAPFLLATVLGLFALPFVVDRGVLQTMFEMLTLLALAQYWNLLAGYAGLVSVGQQAFVGLGGYVLFALAANVGVDPFMAVLLAGVAAALVAAPVAGLVFRLSGPYFAIGTWVVAEAMRLIAAVIPGLGGGTGASLTKSVVDGSFAVSTVASAMGLRNAAARDVDLFPIRRRLIRRGRE